MADRNSDTETLQVEISLSLLCRLLREGSVVTSELHYLNQHPFDASRYAVKASVIRNG